MADNPGGYLIYCRHCNDMTKRVKASDPCPRCGKR